MNLYAQPSDLIAHCCDVEGFMYTCCQCTAHSLAVLVYCYVRRIKSKREKSWLHIVDTMSESLERVEHIEVAKSGDFSETTTQYENVEQVE